MKSKLSSSNRSNKNNIGIEADERESHPLPKNSPISRIYKENIEE